MEPQPAAPLDAGRLVDEFLRLSQRLDSAAPHVPPVPPDRAPSPNERHLVERIGYTLCWIARELGLENPLPRAIGRYLKRWTPKDGEAAREAAIDISTEVAIAEQLNLAGSPLSRINKHLRRAAVRTTAERVVPAAPAGADAAPIPHLFLFASKAAEPEPDPDEVLRAVDDVSGLLPKLRDVQSRIAAATGPTITTAEGRTTGPDVIRNLEQELQLLRGRLSASGRSLVDAAARLAIKTPALAVYLLEWDEALLDRVNQELVTLRLWALERRPPTSQPTTSLALAGRRTSVGQTMELPFDDSAAPPRTANERPSHSDDFATVYWPPLGRFKFNQTQAKVVGQLWNEWGRGGHALLERTIAQNLKSNNSRFRLANVFRTQKMVKDARGKMKRRFVPHSAWGTLIIRDGENGAYRLPTAPITE